jgi:hypothetical protein
VVRDVGATIKPEFRRKLLKAEFRKAENWYLEQDPSGGYMVVLTAGE